ncbi:unnamed protein product, partial [Rotaria socialis]
VFISLIDYIIFITFTTDSYRNENMIPSITLTSSSESTTDPQRDAIINDVTSSSSHSNDEDFLDNTEMIIKKEQK